MTTHAAVKEAKPGNQLSGTQKQERKKQVLTKKRASATRSIADAIVIKSGDIFFLSQPDGNIPMDDSHGFGLYYHDCRFLNGYLLTVANTGMVALVSTITSGSTAVFELTNPELETAQGSHIQADQIGLTWERSLDDKQTTLKDRIRFINYSHERVEFSLKLAFQASFEDIFAIRGLMGKQLATLHPPEWRKDDLVFFYEGGDGMNRTLSVNFSPHAGQKETNSAQFDIAIDPEQSSEIAVTLAVSEQVKSKQHVHAWNSGQGEVKESGAFRQLDERTTFHSDSLLLNQILDNSLRDLHMLVTRIDQYDFFAAGIPWFTTLFGRDSLITGLQTLALWPEIAAETLRLLAKFQAKGSDDWRDAQPGKILHELRIGEMANLNEIPQTPYYGTVDATPLFLILLIRHAEWTGSLDLFHELRDNIEAALQWIDRYGDANGDGYVEYQSSSGKGLVNQGWKDSGNGIVDGKGRLAKPPISLVEVQGYVYEAKNGLARLFERAGEKSRAEQLRREAEKLRASFNRDFWLEDQGLYTLALEAGNQPLRVVSSNPGQALWSGIADADKAKQTAERLMEADMFSGWGIRTLSSQDPSYNPIGYHLGTVWPHDNALIAAGFRRYGLDDQAEKIFDGLLEASMGFEGYRLPELFSGFSRAEYRVPVHYPVACHPQAWAAGSIPYLIGVFLGLEPAAFDSQLRIHRPILPSFVNEMQVKGLRVGKASADLRFTRQPGGSVKVDVEKVKGKLEIVQ
jgi:glycogen debranching enzyme